MGLCINWTPRVPENASVEGVAASLRGWREACLDLPFDDVSELVHFGEAEIKQRLEDRVDPFRWFVLQASAFTSPRTSPSRPRRSPPPSSSAALQTGVLNGRPPKAKPSNNSKKHKRLNRTMNLNESIVEDAALAMPMATLIPAFSRGEKEAEHEAIRRLNPTIAEEVRPDVATAQTERRLNP